MPYQGCVGQERAGKSTQQCCITPRVACVTTALSRHTHILQHKMYCTIHNAKKLNISNLAEKRSHIRLIQFLKLHNFEKPIAKQIFLLTCAPAALLPAHILYHDLFFLFDPSTFLSHSLASPPSLTPDLAAAQTLVAGWEISQIRASQLRVQCGMSGRMHAQVHLDAHPHVTLQ